MAILSIRSTFFIGFVIAAALLGFAGYLQFVEGVMPCPLCQIQRFLVAIIGFLFFVAAIHNPRRKGIKIYSSLVIITALLGGLLSARQLWLQMHPPLEPVNCGVGLYYLLNALPFPEVLRLMLMGTDDCAHIAWQFLGISLPGWTLLFFVLFMLVGFYQLIRIRKLAI